LKRLPFWKLDGAGNDFVLVDARRVSPRAAPALARRLCARRTGAGADGLLLVRAPARGRLARVLYFNADGSRAFCGNGLRCAAFWMRRRGWTGAVAELAAGQGTFTARAAGAGRMRLSMPAAARVRRKLRLRAKGRTFFADAADTGAPHAVIAVSAAALERIPLSEIGPLLRRECALGSRGANIDFIARKGAGLKLRTFERGVEAETLACGTGAVAAALLSSPERDGRFRKAVFTRGGACLMVRWIRAQGRVKDVSLEGPARVVFEGIWEESR